MVGTLQYLLEFSWYKVYTKKYIFVGGGEVISTLENKDTNTD